MIYSTVIEEIDFCYVGRIEVTNIIVNLFLCFCDIMRTRLLEEEENKRYLVFMLRRRNTTAINSVANWQRSGNESVKSQILGAICALLNVTSARFNIVLFLHL